MLIGVVVLVVLELRQLLLQELVVVHDEELERLKNIYKRF